MKRLKQIVLGLGMAAAIAAAPVPVYAMEDGAYTVGRTTSYANPETGQTVDGGTNIALGDSMCESIVEDSARWYWTVSGENVCYAWNWSDVKCE